MRARAAEEDIRQRELFNAIVRNPLPLSYDSQYSEGISNAIIRAKAPEAVRSLANDSKFVPVAYGANPVDIDFKGMLPDQRHELMKHQLKLEDLFPPRLALRAKEESLERADDTVHTEAINLKNERLMHKLLKIEKARDEKSTRPLDEFIGELLQKGSRSRRHRKPSSQRQFQPDSLPPVRTVSSRGSNASSIPSLPSRASHISRSSRNIPLLPVSDTKPAFYRPLLSRKGSEAPSVSSPKSTSFKYSLGSPAFH